MTITPAMAECLEKLDRAAASIRVAGFFRYSQAMLALSDAEYLAWKTKRHLHDLQPENVIALIQARLKNKSPLLITNQMPKARWEHKGAIKREIRSLRETRRMARMFAPMRSAAE